MAKKTPVREVETPVEPEPKTISISEITRSTRKKEVGVDYFLNELAGKEIIITSVDVADQVFEAIVDGERVRVAYRGAVATKKLKAVADAIKATGAAVKARVVRRESRSGRTYIDLV
ncbi:MAG: hypothetical protein LM580_07585 [Thermofilum sp.]|nr:hypothetical protein [Thermofilum sp.]